MNTHGQEDTEHPATPSSSASSTLHRDQRQRAGSTPPPPHRPAPDNGGPPPLADPAPPPPLRLREEEEEEGGGEGKRRILGADIQPKKGQKIVDRKCSLCKRLFKYPRQTTWISDTFKLISKDVFCLECGDLKARSAEFQHQEKVFEHERVVQLKQMDLNEAEKKRQHEREMAELKHRQEMERLELTSSRVVTAYES